MPGRATAPGVGAPGAVDRFGNKEAIVLWDLERRVPELLDALDARFGRDATDPAVRSCAGWFSSTVRVAVDEWVATGGSDTFTERITPSFLNLGAALDLSLSPT